jgi:putative drug exporter of the RND superfamily
VGLAFAVAVDAFVVRMTIVSAVMALLGRSAWWLPRWLDRLLPNVDVEGEKLRRQFEPQLPEPEPELVSNRA